uniref:HSF_DOMAIN domain-containing protein n=1 Tax=Rhabditophanes sp. KR3021 TaxID=114890 RepID=A0AC35TH63_9BILA
MSNHFDANRALAIPNNQTQLAKAETEDERESLFVRKLWRIVNDPDLDQKIEWDRSGSSFHIKRPDEFGRDVLPNHFKHNNLQSFIRQLNMYGFKKNTAIDKTSLVGCQTAADHLEFSHPYFKRGQSHLLRRIVRKQSVAKINPNHSTQFAIQNLIPKQEPYGDIKHLLDEIKILRERQTQTERKLQELTTSNDEVWKEIDCFRNKHRIQQSVIKKLCGVISILGRSSNQPKRLGKRHMLAIDEIDAKKPRGSRLPIMPRNNRINQQNSDEYNANRALNAIINGLERNLDPNERIYDDEDYGDEDEDGPIISDITENDILQEALMDDGLYDEPLLPPPRFKQKQNIQNTVQRSLQSVRPIRNNQMIMANPNRMVSSQPQRIYRNVQNNGMINVPQQSIVSNQQIHYENNMQCNPQFDNIQQMQQHQPVNIGMKNNYDTQQIGSYSNPPLNNTILPDDLSEYLVDAQQSSIHPDSPLDEKNPFGLTEERQNHLNEFTQSFDGVDESINNVRGCIAELWDTEDTAYDNYNSI